MCLQTLQHSPEWNIYASNAQSINILDPEAKLYLKEGHYLNESGATVSLHSSDKYKEQKILQHFQMWCCYAQSSDIFRSITQTLSAQQQLLWFHTSSCILCPQAEKQQKQVRAILFFLRQGDVVRAFRTNGITMTAGENRGFKEGTCFSILFLLFHHVIKYDIVMPMFPAYHLDTAFKLTFLSREKLEAPHMQ